MDPRESPFISSEVSSPLRQSRLRRLSSTKSDLIKFEVECLKFVLKETVDKLIIANGGEKAAAASETKFPMKIRYRESREKLFHEETLEPIHEAMERMIFVKLGNDAARLRKILSETITDLDNTNDFRSLKFLIDTGKATYLIKANLPFRNLFNWHRNSTWIRRKRWDAFVFRFQTRKVSLVLFKLLALIEQNSKQDNLYKFLEKKFDEDTKMYKTKVKEIDDRISEVEGELNDLKVENKIKLQLLNDWETTRHGQIKFITENKEKQLTVAAENYKKDATRELRLKHEIESKKQS